MKRTEHEAFWIILLLEPVKYLVFVVLKIFYFKGPKKMYAEIFKDMFILKSACFTKVCHPFTMCKAIFINLICGYILGFISRNIFIT